MLLKAIVYNGNSSDWFPLHGVFKTCQNGAISVIKRRKFFHLYYKFLRLSGNPRPNVIYTSQNTKGIIVPVQLRRTQKLNHDRSLQELTPAKLWGSHIDTRKTIYQALALGKTGQLNVDRNMNL